MRKYTIPQSMTVEYLLGDHLGSTSITTDNTGAKVSEMRYKPWGELRYSWTSTPATTPAYALTKYTYTGQYSYMDDPTTTGVTEGFGLMFYREASRAERRMDNARWYDPALGRFVPADTIIPPGIQGLDRYAYVNNSPMNFTDPSGHECAPANECVGPNGQGEPDNVDFSQLTDVTPDRKYSGWMMYSLYLKAWEANGGYLSIKTFITIMLANEFQPYVGKNGNVKIDESFLLTLKTAAANWFWCSPNADTNSCTNLRQSGSDMNAGMLNWIGGMESVRRRYDNVFIDGASPSSLLEKQTSYSLTSDVMNFVLYESSADGHLYLNQPFYWANRSLPLTGIGSASQGWAYNQYVRIFGASGNDPAYILTPCQTAFFRQNIGYLHDVCNVP